jgi:Ca2+-binding RTX toxin-like protein
MQQLERRYLGVLELVGGDSDNVIYATGVFSPFETTLLVDAGAGDDLVLGGSLVFGNDGNDDLRSSPLLIGGNGDDRLEGSRGARFVFTSSELGIDAVVAPWTSATEYVGWYYDSLGMPDWSERLTKAAVCGLRAGGQQAWSFSISRRRKSRGRRRHGISTVGRSTCCRFSARHGDARGIRGMGGLSRDVALLVSGLRSKT